jgi:hypothetical protein
MPLRRLFCIRCPTHNTPKCTGHRLGPAIVRTTNRREIFWPSLQQFSLETPGNTVGGRGGSELAFERPQVGPGGSRSSASTSNSRADSGWKSPRATADVSATTVADSRRRRFAAVGRRTIRVGDRELVTFGGRRDGIEGRSRNFSADKKRSFSEEWQHRNASYPPPAACLAGSRSITRITSFMAFGSISTTRPE